MKVGQLKRVLAKAKAIYDAGGATDKAAALDSFANLLQGHENKTVAGFVTSIERKRGQRKS